MRKRIPKIAGPLQTQQAKNEEIKKLMRKHHPKNADIINCEIVRNPSEKA